MKRALVVFVFGFVLVAVCVAAAALPIHGSREQVAVITETTVGDISAAEGFTARQSAHMGQHLRWDLTIPLARPGDTEAEYTYSRGRMGRAYPTPPRPGM